MKKCVNINAVKTWIIIELQRDLESGEKSEISEKSPN